MGIKMCNNDPSAHTWKAEAQRGPAGLSMKPHLSLSFTMSDECN